MRGWNLKLRALVWELRNFCRASSQKPILATDQSLLEACPARLCLCGCLAHCFCFHLGCCQWHLEPECSQVCLFACCWGRREKLVLCLWSSADDLVFFEEGPRSSGVKTSITFIGKIRNVWCFNFYPLHKWLIITYNLNELTLFSLSVSLKSETLALSSASISGLKVYKLIRAYFTYKIISSDK